MTPEELDAAAEELITRSRIDLGLPRHIAAPELLAPIVALLRAGAPRAKGNA